MIVSKNALEEEVAEEMAKLWFDKELERKVVKDFRKTSAYKRGNHNLGNLMHYLPTLWLKYALEMMQGKYPKRIIISHMPEDEQTEPLFFEYREGQLIVKAGGEDYSKINRVAMIDGLPVLLDIRIGKFKERGTKTPGRKKRRYSKDGYVTHPSSRGVKYAVRETRVEQVMKPIAKYASMEGQGDKRCGYILFIADHKHTQNSAIVKKFRKKNGILQPLPKDRDGARTDIERICQSNKIVYRKGGFKA